MAPVDARDQTRRLQEQRLGRLRRRAVLGSALAFAAFLGLAAQHAVGSGKRAAAPTTPPVARPAAYFDQQGDAFAFDDGSSEPPLPPVAQTNVS